jgi:hypothetical protein
VKDEKGERRVSSALNFYEALHNNYECLLLPTQAETQFSFSEQSVDGEVQAMKGE